MNILKTAFASACVITCCMGNEYPAKAGDVEAFNAGYDYGYTYGFAVSACAQHHFGYIDYSTLLMQLEAIQGGKSGNAAIDAEIVKSFENAERSNGIGKGTREAALRCLPAVRRVFGSPARSTGYRI